MYFLVNFKIKVAAPIQRQPDKTNKIGQAAEFKKCLFVKYPI